MKFLLIVVLVLISYNFSTAQERKMNVAVLIYDGVYVLDFTGPIEVFTDTFINDTTNTFNVFTISTNTEMITAHSGLNVIPDYTFSNCPDIDIFIIPGGNPGLINNDSNLKKEIIRIADKSKYTMSVCTGAFILAKTGMLDGLEATTWHGALNRLQSLYPKIIVKSTRWTDNGKFLTTSGVSAGIDGSLYLVSKIFGKKIADATAKYMDYEYWK